MSCVSRRRLVMVVATCAFGLAGGCLSPTLPLPPPGPPEVTETETAGVYRLRGSVTPHAQVTAWNTRTDLTWGQLTGSDGAYEFLVEGEPGDLMRLYYQIGTDQSDAEDFELP